MITVVFVNEGRKRHSKRERNVMLIALLYFHLSEGKNGKDYFYNGIRSVFRDSSRKGCNGSLLWRYIAISNYPPTISSLSSLRLRESEINLKHYKGAVHQISIPKQIFYSSFIQFVLFSQYMTPFLGFPFIAIYLSQTILILFFSYF